MRHIVFDGCDGVGKTTQLNLLAELLKSKGKNVMVTKALGGNGSDFVQNQLRAILLSPHFPSDDNASEEILFAVADSRNLKFVEEFLSASPNNYVVQDRGMASHAVYCAAKNMTTQDIVSYHDKLYKQYINISEKYGSLNIILIPEKADLSLKRIKSRGESVVSRLENLEMQQRVSEGMLVFGSSDVYQNPLTNGMVTTTQQTVGDINVLYNTNETLATTKIIVSEQDGISVVQYNIWQSIRYLYE
jgi:dTMP kinase